MSRQFVDGLVAGERIEAGLLPSAVVGAGEHLEGANTSSGDLPSSCKAIPSTAATGQHPHGDFPSTTKGTGDHLNGALTSWGDHNSNATALQSEQQLLDSLSNQQRENSSLETKVDFSEIDQDSLRLNPCNQTPHQPSKSVPWVLLRGVPAALQEAINETSFEVYRERYEQVSQGLRVWVLTRGIAAPELYARLQATPDPNTFSWTSAPVVEEQVNIPKLCSLLKIMLIPSLTVLSFKQLSLLSSVSQNVFDEFKRFLSLALLHLPSLKSLTLCSHNSRNSLPQCDNEHLKLLGLHCPELQYLDISFNKGVTGEGVRALVPSESVSGCPNLTKLLIFDCAVFEKEVAKVLPQFNQLEYLGYKETGKALKSIHRAVEDGNLIFAPLLLTHVDNLGSKARRLIASTLRCKKPVALAISLLCPGVRNLKLRVADDDCAHLAGLEKLEALELVYHVGSLGSPGPGTAALLQARGSLLTSLAIKCNSLTMAMLVTIAESCPGLAQLWARCNHLTAPWEVEEAVRRPHAHLTNLHTLYFRVGENELAVTSVPSYVLQYLLRNTGPRLRELIIAMRSSVITDQ